jgi:beta-glucosidase
MNSNEITTLISRMTLEQKARFCSGKNFWNLEGLEELGIPSVMVTDGPHGLRKQKGSGDHVGLSDSVPAVCFPTASAIACSWDENLIEEMGSYLGEECLQENVAVLLGPGANIKRSPLCGRNFEYFSEDPYLTGKLAAALIRGVESRGVGTSLKHYAANNQETRRMTIDTLVDDRALREIYLTGFEIAVKEGRPATVMNAYNRINGTYCAENSKLLTDILKREWGHEGFVVTDWGAENDRVSGLKAGQELEMPGPGDGNTRLIVDAVNSGELEEAVLDEALRRLLTVIFRTWEALKPEISYDQEAHHEKAKQVLVESAVLLKNDGILPLRESGSVAVIGEFARKPRYQGSGSSLINPTRIDNAWDAVSNLTAGQVELSYARGYDSESEAADQKLIDEAVAVARNADIALVFAGLPDISESEGFDRQHLEMPEAHNRLIEAVATANPRTVVVLSNGAPVTMPWLDKVDAVLESYLGGQAWGSAVADLVFGRANPSGKLAESFPRSLDDVPATVNFPGGTQSVAYAESVYVGYRYYDKAQTSLLFPFGYGLSYTEFEYTGLRIGAADTDGNATVSLQVTNTGPVAGKEIVQLYLQDSESTVFRPEKELKAFAKVALEPGETKSVELRLNRRSFAFWDSGAQRWAVEAGDLEILIGSSSADIRLRESVRIDSGDDLSSWAKNQRQNFPGYYEPSITRFADLSPAGDFARLMGRPLPDKDIPSGAPITRISTLHDVRHTFVGGIIYKGAMRNIAKMAGDNADTKTREMMAAVVRELPLKSMAIMGPGLSMDTVDGLITMMNGRFLRGLWQVLRGRKK